MLRSGASRSLLRSLNASSSPASKITSQAFQRQITSQITTYARRPRSLALAKPLAVQLSLVPARFATTDKSAPLSKIDPRHESEVGKEKLEVHPELVSAESSTHPLMSEVGREEEEKDADMMAGIRGDLQTIRDTFSLDSVPREAYYVGLAGVIPYLATSASTIYCAWEINHAHETGAGLLMSDHTAELCLHILEPLQIGYGATIISFLGAIHWGLEFAKYGGEHGYRRYGIGIAATAAAWPTILLPAEYALISQFLIFNFLYYRDARATRQGWCPQWYGVYRFVLTFIVGASIVASLVGRGQIADRIGKLPSPADRVRALRDSQMQSLQDEEEARRKYLVSKDEEEEEEEEE